jgi:uncharacterized protein (TIGR02466 family)
MRKKNIYPIFPTAVYKNSLATKLNQKIKNFMYSYETKQNHGNKSSINHYVLEDKNLKDVKKQLEFYLCDYFKDIIKTKNKAKPYITQSWVNYTNKKEHHHIHSHQNSYLSGVLYVETENDEDCITFHKTTNDILKFDQEDYNEFNCTTNTFKIKTGDILIFPSMLVHSVPVRFKGAKPRISIAFNSWVKGTIGNNEVMTELRI